MFGNIKVVALTGAIAASTFIATGATTAANAAGWIIGLSSTASRSSPSIQRAARWPRRSTSRARARSSESTCGRPTA